MPCKLQLAHELIHITHTLPLPPADTTYPGGVTFQGTGLGFSSDASTVKASIALLKQRNPGTKVLIAVGGATYTSFNKMNAPAIAAFVSAFGLDGEKLSVPDHSDHCR